METARLGGSHPLLSRWTASHLHYSRAREKLKERASFERYRSNKVFAKCKSPAPPKDTIDSPSLGSFEGKMISDHGLQK